MNSQVQLTDTAPDVMHPQSTDHDLDSSICDKVGPQDFVPLKLLGSGSFGEVYLVKFTQTG